MLKVKQKNDILKELLKQVKLKDAGKKANSSDCMEAPSKGRINYPSLYLSTKQCPDIKGKEVGDELTLLIKAGVTGHNLYEVGKDSRENYDIEIKKIGLID